MVTVTVEAEQVEELAMTEAELLVVQATGLLVVASTGVLEEVMVVELQSAQLSAMAVPARAKTEAVVYFIMAIVVFGISVMDM